MSHTPDEHPDPATAPDEPDSNLGSAAGSREEPVDPREREFAELLDSVPTDQFDASGLPAGPGARRLWEHLCLSIEEHIDVDGWDQHARVFAVLNPVQTRASLGEEVFERMTRHVVGTGELGAGAAVDDAAEWGALDGVRGVFSVADLGPVPGHPVTELWGTRMPQWAAAAVLAFEGWSSPEGTDPANDPYGHLRPSQRPDRVEVRGVHLMTRSNVSYSATRVRGSDPVALGGPAPDENPNADTGADPGPAGGGGSGPAWDGFLVDVLRRTLAVPTAPAPPGAVGSLLGAMVLEASVYPVLRLLGALTDDNESALTDEMTTYFAALAPHEKSPVLASMWVKAAAATMANLVWDLTNHGQGPAPVEKPLRKHLRALTRPETTPEAPEGATEDDQGSRVVGGLRAQDWELLVGAAQQVARVGLVELAAGKRAAALFGPDVARVCRDGWADEGIVFSQLARRGRPNQGEVLEVLDAAVSHAGVDDEVFAHARALVLELLTAGGWRDTGSGEDQAAGTGAPSD